MKEELESGIYNLIINLAEQKKLKIGSLGEFEFKKGYYIYTGTAQRALQSRLARHRRQEKKLHWHIDYLLAEAELVEVLIWPGEKKDECRLHQYLAQRQDLELPVLGFGASDCSCQSHLLYSVQWPQLDNQYNLG